MNKNYLIITHNQTAFQNFMLPYVEGKSYQTILLKDGLLKSLFLLAKLSFNGRKYTVLSQHPLALLLAPFLIFRVKYKWVHFVTGQVWAGKSNSAKNFLLEIADRVLLCFPTIKVCDSKGQFEFLKNRWPNWPNIEFTGIGSMGGITPIESSVLCNSEDVIKVCWIGRDSRDKDLMTLLKAIQQLNKEDFHLFVFGIKAKNTENVTYLGFVDDIRSKLRQLDISINVVTSHREGFCMAILESASVGITTISSRIYGTSEIVEFIKVEDFCFPPGGANELARSLIRYKDLSRDQKLRLRDYASNVNSEYSQKNVVNVFNKFIEKK